MSVCIDWWVSGFLDSSFHHHHFRFKLCASANKPCLAGEHHGRNICGQQTPPTFISLLIHARQRKSYGLQCVILNSANCQVRIPNKYYIRTEPPPTNINFIFQRPCAGCAGGRGGQKKYTRASFCVYHKV